MAGDDPKNRTRHLSLYCRRRRVGGYRRHPCDGTASFGPASETTGRDPLTKLTFDPDALRAKYRDERDKRLRPDGNDQYLEAAGRLAHFVDDPYITVAARPPLTDQVDVVVIGAGFGGLIAGARLTEGGVESLRIIEKGGDFGGTWYWNRYPGARCDVESYIYLPLLEEVGYMPTDKYSAGGEILAYSRRLAEHFRLPERALFGTEVTSARWDETKRRWIVATNRDDAIEARFVIMSSGPLHRPKLPGIEGIETFAGHSFHTSRWDYDYTGGDADGGLVGLADKRVGVIGTGASALQCVPYLAEACEHLYVFQRTPASVDVRANAPTDPAWVESLAPGWHRARMENFNTLLTSGLAEEDLVNDGWTDVFSTLIHEAVKGQTTLEGIVEAIELADFKKMEQIRARVDELVDDPGVAEALKPWYRQFCKRPCFHDEYLQTFNRSNVTLVDTDGKGVERVTEHAVVANGVAYEVDCLVFATGFEVGTGYTRRSGCEFYGVDGLTLTEKWSEGMRTLHGIFTRRFPNCFVVSHSQGGYTVNYPHMLDEVSTHIAYVIGEAIARGCTRVEPSRQAEDDWVAEIVSSARPLQSFHESCTPSYYNNEGHPGGVAIQNGHHGGGSPRFFKMLADWRAAGDLAGLETS